MSQYDEAAQSDVHRQTLKNMADKREVTVVRVVNTLVKYRECTHL